MNLNKSKIDRRYFFKTSVAISSSMVLEGMSGCEGQADPQKLQPSVRSRVVTIQQPGIVSSGLKLDNERVENLLNEGLRHWFDLSSVTRSWQSIVSPNDVVGIKVNCLAGRGLSTHPAVVDAIIAGLLKAGVKKRNIYIWDRLNNDLRRAGFKVSTQSRGIKYLGNDSLGYSNELTCHGAVGSLVSRAVTDICTALINVPILKDHGIVGVSVALKNYFGAIHNPNKYHDNIGDPYVADVNMFPDLRQKTRFTICDALVAQYEGGPPYMPHWAWPFGGLILGTDMVAIDQIGWQIIEEKRREKGQPSLKEAGREPSYIATAASENYRLGTNDPNQIEDIRIQI